MPRSKLSSLDPHELSGNPRATLPAWLQYQSIVLQAVHRHPLPFTFSPQNKSAQTVVSRIRDAVRGCLTFGYDIGDPAISPESLLRWFGEVVFKAQGDLVTIGVPEKLKDRLVISTPSSELHFPTLSFEEISAFQLLLSTSRLTGPVIIDSPPDTTLLPARENVEILVNEKKQLVLF